MLKKLLDQIIDYQEYLEKISPTQAANNQLRQYFYKFADQIGRPHFSDTQKSATQNILSLCVGKEQNCLQELQTIQFKLKMIVHLAGIDLKKKSTQNIQLMNKKLYQDSQCEQNQILNRQNIKSLKQWYISSRTSLIQNDVTVQQAWDKTDFTYMIQLYGEDRFSYILSKFNKNSHSSQFYLWQFFDALFQALDQDDSKQLKKTSSEKQQERLINLAEEELNQLDQVIDLSKKMSQLSDFSLINEELYRERRFKIANANKRN